MQFQRSAVNFDGAMGFAYLPLDAQTNYRRIIILEPKPVPEGGVPDPGSPTRKFFFYEYFEGQRIWEKVPIMVSKKRKIGSHADVYPLEELVEKVSYFSPPIDTPETVEAMSAWLELNAVVK